MSVDLALFFATPCVIVRLIAFDGAQLLPLPWLQAISCGLGIDAARLAEAVLQEELAAFDGKEANEVTLGELALALSLALTARTRKN